MYTKISPNLVPPPSSDVATCWQVDPKTDSPTQPEHDENNDEEGEEDEPNKGPSANKIGCVKSRRRWTVIGYHSVVTW